MSETGLIISTATDTPVISPLSSVKSSISSPSSRSLSPVSSNPSAVSSPQIGPDTISNRINNRNEGEQGQLFENGQNSNDGGRISQDSFVDRSASSSSEEESSGTLARKLQGLKLSTKAEPQQRMKMTLIPPSGVHPSGAHTRTSPLYSPSHYLLVSQKDGQVYNLEVPLESGPVSPVSVMSNLVSPGTAGTTYFPGTWTSHTLSPTTLHPHLRPFSQQATPRGEFGVPSPTGLYPPENQFLQVVPQQQHSHYTFPTTTPHALSPTTSTPLSGQPFHHYAQSSASDSTIPTSGNLLSVSSSGGVSSSVSSGSGSASGLSSTPTKKTQEKDSKIDNKHIFPRQEVIRDMFYTSESPTTVMGTATHLGQLLVPTPVHSPTTQTVHTFPSTQVSQVSQVPQVSQVSQVSQYERQKVSPVSTPTTTISTVPSYIPGYPYPVYYDPTTHITYGYAPSHLSVQTAQTFASTSQPTALTSGTTTGSTQLTSSQIQQLSAQQVGGSVQPVMGQMSQLVGGVGSVGVGIGVGSHPQMIIGPSGELIANTASPRAFPLTGEWPGPFYARPRGPRVRPGVCLFVFHIPPSVTDEELYALFSTCGRVLSAKVMRNSHTGESKGFGFVNMANQRDVEQAIGTLHGYFWKNKYLKVSYKKKRYYSRN